jgi:protein-ribulosamine 3-kinase
MNWQVLGDMLSEYTGIQYGRMATPLQGGSINEAYRLGDDRHQIFVKLNRGDRLEMFNAEQAGLEAIRNSGSIRVPEVFATGRIADQSFIAMEYIELGGKINPDQFASALAAMHNCKQQRFGFDCDNTIGSTAQPNTWTDNWIDFWRRYRLGFQLELARENGIDPNLIDAGERLCGILESFFSNYQPQGSLLHGDLWQGNYAADNSGQVVIYDPACYFGDHEADLAMMELFGHPGERFFEVYRDSFDIDDGYRARRDLYNLYHLLNHANLFGGGYAAQALQLIQKLMAQV